MKLWERTLPRRARVLDCGSPLPFWLACPRSGKGLPQSKTLRETQAADGNAGARQMERLRPRERGSLLIIVMWIAFGLVALTLYFAHSMSLELRAADNRVAAMEADQAIDGAARYLSNILTTVVYPGIAPSPADYWCEAVPVGDATFWLIGRDTNDWEINLTTPSFGLVDEASKINLNAPWLTADSIQYLPSMTLELAEAIMDWRDSDSDISTNGAEDETYSRLPQPYKAKNGAFESVEELRLVAGVTAEILYGEDANLNGILDVNENDGDQAPPYDNRDGRLDPGLMEYFTVYSREPGGVGTNINTQADVQALLETALSQSRVTEIIRELFQASGGSPGPGSGSSGAGAGVTPPQRTNLMQFYLNSGMTEDEFALVSDYLTATTNAFTEGLVNVNTASQPVLECIPGIGLDYAEQLITYREATPAKLTTVAWVLNVVGETNALTAGPYITTRSYQSTADVAALGHHDRGYQRARFVFDTSEGNAIILRREDLTHLGWALGKDIRTQILASKEKR